MKCKKAERYLLRSFDGLLENRKREELDKHLERCPLCQKKRGEYQIIFETLKKHDFPELKPYFWSRLQPKLKEQRKYEPWSLWKRWSLRAIPLSLLLVVILVGSIIFLIPEENEELSQSGILLRNLNPLQETTLLLEEEGIENKNMMLIFTAMENKNGVRRYFP